MNCVRALCDAKMSPAIAGGICVFCTSSQLRTCYVPIAVLLCVYFAQAIVELYLSICARSIIMHNQN